MKRLVNTAFFYAIFAMVAGVAYREGTRFLQVTEETPMSLVHTHLFAMGMLIFLVAAALEGKFTLTAERRFKSFYFVYNAGLLITVGSMIWRSVYVFFSLTLADTVDKAISWTAGAGHVLLAIGLILFFLVIKGRTTRDGRTARAKK